MNLAIDFGEIIPSRSMNHLYIYLDIAFLVFFMSLLIYKKRYCTAIFALCGGLLYFAVDFGIFYKLLETRKISGVDPGWFLLWLSMSYGITNFAWIWLWIKKDKHLLEWSLLIVVWWICCPLISQNFGGSADISIYRGTGSYHGIMAIFMIVGYSVLFIYNMVTKGDKVKILWLLAIGILVQFSWEFCLLVTGIRASGFGPLVVNSLVETNMGIPYIFGIYLLVSKYFTEDLHKKCKLGEKHETER